MRPFVQLAASLLLMSAAPVSAEPWHSPREPGQGVKQHATLGRTGDAHGPHADRSAPIGVNEPGVNRAAPIGVNEPGVDCAAPIGVNEPGVNRAAPIGVNEPGVNRAAPIGVNEPGVDCAAPIGVNEPGVNRAAPVDGATKARLARPAARLPDPHSPRARW
jgi:hypothetical protein